MSGFKSSWECRAHWRFWYYSLVATFVWNNNPDLSDFTWRKLIYETQRAWRDLLSGEYGKRRRPPKTATASAAAKSVDKEEEKPLLPALETSEEAKKGPEKATADTDDEGQLSFDLTKKSALFEDEKPKKEENG